MRLVEIYLSTRGRTDFDQEIEAHHITEMWEDRLANDKVLLKLLLPNEDTTLLMDRLKKHFRGSGDFKILVLPVEGSIPRVSPNRQTVKHLPVISFRNNFPSGSNLVPENRRYRRPFPKNRGLPISDGYLKVVSFTT